MKKKLVVMFFATILILSGCTNSTANQKYTFESLEVGFDTFVSFTAYADSQTTFNRYSKLLSDEFLRYDKLFDKYNSYDKVANIKTINDNAGKNPVIVDKEIINLLKQAKQFSEFSDNRFDITIGSLLNVWHDFREKGMALNENNQNGILPSFDILNNAYKHHGWNHIIIDESNNSVYIDDAQVQLDVGANAKGFAVQRVTEKIRKAGLKSGFINAGGNVSLIGQKDEGNNWKVGIQVPDKKSAEGDSLISFDIKDGLSFVTSGDYQRFYKIDEQLIHHIIDPKTLYPSKFAKSVTIVTEDSSIADILSTTLFTMSYEDGLALLTKLNKEQSIDVNAVWVFDKTATLPSSAKTIIKNDYQIIVSDNLTNSIIK